MCVVHGGFGVRQRDWRAVGVRDVKAHGAEDIYRLDLREEVRWLLTPTVSGMWMVLKMK